MTRTFKTIIWVGFIAVIALVVSIGKSDTYHFFKEKALVTVSPKFENFVDMYGNTVGYEDYRGKRLLVVFGYTHCVDVCPVSLANMSNILYDIEDIYGLDEAQKYQVLFFTVDPERDTPQILLNTIDGVFHKNIIGVWGNVSDMTRLTKQFGVTFRKSQDDPRYYTMAHTANMFLLDENGAYKTQFAHTVPPRLALPIIYRYFDTPN